MGFEWGATLGVAEGCEGPWTAHENIIAYLVLEDMFESGDFSREIEQFAQNLAENVNIFVDKRKLTILD